VVTGQAEFFPYFDRFHGPVRVGTGDVDGDGVADIITGAGPGGGPHVRAWSMIGSPPIELTSFYAYAPELCDIPDINPDPLFCDGIYVAGGDVDGDGKAEIITGTNRSGGPLRVFKIDPGISSTEFTSFFPYFEAFQGPVRVAGVRERDLPGLAHPSPPPHTQRPGHQFVESVVSLTRTALSGTPAGRARAPPILPAAFTGKRVPESVGYFCPPVWNHSSWCTDPASRLITRDASGPLDRTHFF
jgi:hypothetical protein